jgi:TRAP-type uncharacterized transport system substrate-binding protein
MEKKEITFAGSTFGEPWWTLGEIVAKVLEPKGYSVKISDQSYSDNNVRWISGRKAEIGATTMIHMRSATRGIYEYTGEEYKDFTLIATIKRPRWLAMAIRHETGLRDLRQVKERKYPLRLLAHGAAFNTVLLHYGISPGEIEAWGGTRMKWAGLMTYIREGLVDMMMGNVYVGYTANNKPWFEATMLYDMRFLDFDDALIEKLVSEHGFERGAIPHGLMRGVDRDIPSVCSEDTYIYCLKNQPEDLVRFIAEGLDKNSPLFRYSRSAFYYERSEVWKSPYIPLHPAAEEYYRSKGYIG